MHACHLLGPELADFDRVVAVHQNLRLDHRHQAVVLSHVDATVSFKCNIASREKLARRTWQMAAYLASVSAVSLIDSGDGLLREISTTARLHTPHTVSNCEPSE